MVNNIGNTGNYGNYDLEAMQRYAAAQNQQAAPEQNSYNNAGIAFTGATAAAASRLTGGNYQAAENLAKYVTGVAFNTPEEGPFTGQGLFLFGIPLATGAFGAGSWAYNAYSGGKDKTGTKGWAGVQEAWEKFKGESKVKQDNFKSVKGFGEKYNYSVRLQTAKEVLEGIPKQEVLDKLDNVSKAHYEKAKQMAEHVVNNPLSKDAEKFAKQAGVSLSEAKVASYGKIKPTKWYDKVAKFFSRNTGYGKMMNKLEEKAIKNPKLGNVLRHSKGTGLFLAITGLVELFTQVIPSFTQLGAEKGTKQLAKSTVKTAANIGGWVAGSAAGAKVGAMLGSFGGPIGTAVGGVAGAIVGFAGGCLGSWLAGKGAEAVVGKNELDIAKDEQYKKLAKQASQSPEVQDQMIQAAAQKLQQEGLASKDAQIAAESLKQLMAIKGMNQEQNQVQSPLRNSSEAPNNQYSAANAYSNPYAAQYNNQYIDPSMMNYQAMMGGATNPFMQNQYNPMMAMGMANPFAQGMNNPFAQQGNNPLEKDFMGSAYGLS